MNLFKKLQQHLDYLSEPQIQQIQKAYELALEAHEGQKRQTGEPYITHPVAVAMILADMKMDAQSITAALLHDVIEDTRVTKETVRKQFGDAVAELVDGVSKLTEIKFLSQAEAQAENFCKMILAVAHDLRVIIIKLSDRLHNMRTLESLPANKRHRVAKETLEIYAPIASRLGMREITIEMEEFAFKCLYPMRYRVLRESVLKARGNRKRILVQIEKELHDAMKKIALPPSMIEGREKHLYSIYRKMLTKHLPFSDIMDVYAFRFITDSVDTCYRILGMVHGLYKPVPERFKDYIAIPKANGYQSLHTTLFGPYGLPIEIQIRTAEMDHTANSGIAAHWRYKSAEDKAPSKFQLRAEDWIHNLLELQRRTKTPLEFLENVKLDLFQDEVYVFTPKGKIIALPSGATAVDFAYAVHTDIGNSCVAVKVDHHLAPLSTPLFSGQTIEVITHQGAYPNPAWLDFVVTSKARSSIRQHLRERSQADAIILGKELLVRALARLGVKLKKFSDAVIETIRQTLHLNSLDDLYAQVGLGERAADVVAQQITKILHLNASEISVDGEVLQPMAVKGTEGMLVKYATCCYPIPGDPIIGVLMSGQGVKIHIDDCKTLARFREQEPEKIIPFRWESGAQGQFATVLSLEVVNRLGVLAKITSAIADANASIEDIEMADKDGGNFDLIMELLVKGRVHLAKVIRNLRTIDAVMKVVRKRF